MTPTPLILGHRGASAVAPENTLAAFKRAMDDGADGIEFDVRLARDNVPVVIHDANLQRTGLVDEIVSDLTSTELVKVDVGTWFDQARSKAVHSESSFAGERIPTLSQVFELFQSREGLLYVEMKCETAEGPALAKAVVNLVRDFEMMSNVVVESFDLSAISAVKQFDSEIRTAALFEPRLSRPISSVRRLKMIELARHHGAKEIAFHYTLLTPRVAETATKEGFDIVVWTVDDLKWIERARALGVKALIANDPATMVQHRNGEDHFVEV